MFEYCHFEIITELTSNIVASSASVCWFFTISRAAFAVNAALNFDAFASSYLRLT